MQRQLLVSALAAVFGAMTAMLIVVGVLFQAGLLLLAVPMGVTAGFIWYHSSGKLRERVRRQAARSGRRAGRDATTGPRGGRAGGFSGGPSGRFEGQRRSRDRRRDPTDRVPTTGPSMSRSEAAEVLGVDPTADGDTVQQAYRRLVKDAHPDTADGDEETFKRVKTAYETLSEDQ